jgi:hypothetical protein
VFVAFGVEIAGELGKEARAFYMQCLEWANGHNDVDSCHWIAMSFRRHWNMRFGRGSKRCPVDYYIVLAALKTS